MITHLGRVSVLCNSLLPFASNFLVTAKNSPASHQHLPRRLSLVCSELHLGESFVAARDCRAMAAYSGFTHKQTAPAVHLLGIVGIVLVLIWTSYYRGGYGLTGAAVFNLHPLFMFAGFIFLSSQAVIAYKTVGGDKRYQKAVHMTLQGVAILLGIVGILFAYKFHHDNNIENFYSLHSWFGMITILTYLIQWILGFVAFWTQSVPSSQRAELLPWHVFVGLTAYVGALATAELGLLEKLTFLQKSSPPVGFWSGEAILVNSIGIAVFVFGAAVVLTAVLPNPRRQEGYSPLE